MTHSTQAKTKRALFATVPRTEISLVNQIPGRKIDPRSLQTVEDCVLVANNESFLSGRCQPQHGLHFLKENVPSLDILEFPEWDEYEDALKNGYEIVGISFYTTNFAAAGRMARMARQAGVQEVWAGNYGALTPGASDVFDRVFNGYPERSVKRIVENRELDSLRHPILTTPFRVLSRGQRAGYLFTIRGCRYRCRFCSATAFSPRIERTSLQEIERVLNTYREMGIHFVLINDETFLQDREHAGKVIELLCDREMQWWCTTRADLLAGRVGELHQKGFRSVYFGIESMRESNLVEQRKGQSSRAIQDVVKELADHRISIAGTYILGWPGDTRESIQRDLEQLNELPLYILIFLVYTPYPGVPGFEELKRNGLITSNDWKDFDGMHLVFRHPHMSAEEVRDAFEYAVTNVYSRLHYNKRRVLKRLEKLRAQQEDAEPPRPAADGPANRAARRAAAGAL